MKRENNRNITLSRNRFPLLICYYGVMDAFTFITACLTAVALLYLPGFFLLRAWGLSRPWCVCASPALSAFLVGTFSFAWCAAGIPCNAFTIALPPVIVGAAVCFALQHTDKESTLAMPVLSGKMLCLYAAVGILAGCFIFLRVLPDFSAFAQAWDNQHHINGIRAFADAQAFDSLKQASFQSALDQQVNPTPDAGFYPSTWMAFCAILIQLFNVSAGFAENAVDFVLCSIVFPLAMAAFFSAIFENDVRKVAIGSLACIAFQLFPWEMLVYGPLLPNLASFCCMPIAMALATSAIAKKRTPRDRIALVILFVVACIGIVFLQPNSIFTMAVLLAPLFVQRIGSSGGFDLGRIHIHAAILAVAFTLFCIGIWVFAYYAPFMQGVVHSGVWHWKFATAEDAVANIVNLAYIRGFYPCSPQIVAAALVIIGIFRAFKDRQHLWMLFAYLLTCIITVSCMSAVEESTKAFFSGFWYSDPFRCGAMASIAAMPLLILGLDWLMTVVVTLCDRALRNEGPSKASKLNNGLCLVLAGAFLFATLAPNVNERFLNGDPHPTSASGTIATWHSIEHGPYTADEMQFAREASHLTGDSLVANQPNDGSFYVYGDTGMRTFYRKFNGYGNIPETKESQLVRDHLHEAAFNDDVRETCRELNMNYVLILHRQNMPEGFIGGQYYPPAWHGLDDINDNTPGFDVVLAKDDMRLYRITCL